MSKLLAKVVIPEYLKRVMMSKARRAKYYSPGDKMPKYLTNECKYEWRKTNKRTNLFNKETDEIVLANPRAAGTPKFQVISGQALYNGQMNPITRAKVFRELKTHLIENLGDLKAITDHPIQIHLEVHDTIREGTSLFDIDNRSYPYIKGFQDVLTGNRGEGFKFIEDDNILHVTTVQSKFIPVATTEERQLIFNIYMEDDPRIIENGLFIRELELFRNGK